MWKNQKNTVLNAAREMLDAKLVIGSQGNASLRFRDDNGVEMVAITPSGLNYKAMKLDDIVVLDMKGKAVGGNKKPSVEFRLHLGIYKKRQDVNAIVHTHSLFSSILSVSGINLPLILDEQIHCLGGEIKVARYAPSGTLELVRSVTRALGTNNAAIMANHGALSVGPDMLQAINNSLLLERVSQILVYAKLLKKLNKPPSSILP